MGADLLAGDLVVDDHLEGVRWGMSWRLKATMWKAESSLAEPDEVGPDHTYAVSVIGESADSSR